MPKTILEETLRYPLILHKEGGTWGYFSPEFGGGGAATITDAIDQATRMIEGAIADLYEADQPIPEPSSLETLDLQGGNLLIVPAVVSNAAERISLTLPKSLIARIDGVTNNRSAFFAELARERLVS